jgi:eukaryotic-like serine/threonine-protein kinase
MSLSPRTKIGPYEVLGSLGAGGMGEVYKARDLRLDRTVAMKILPDHLATDPGFRERFDREARSISQLSHPNICTLFDVGEATAQPSAAAANPPTAAIAYLVLEHLEGETLAARLARGRLTVAEAVKIAMDIAAALDAAHRHGVVHRDLKPANVFLVRTAGAPIPTAKLVDFGLAKASPSGVLTSGATASVPTMQALTAQGTLLGTFQYMAPEQIEGREADARSDIFAFGATLFEMLTGRRAFDGKSQASVIGAILKDEPPPVSQLVPVTPPALDYVVRTCLCKDPDGRFQTAHDLGLQLKWIAEGGGAGVAASVAANRKPPSWLVTAAIATAALLAGAAAAWRLKPVPPAEPRVGVMFREVLPVDQSFTSSRHVIAMAEDGSRIAYVANRQLYVREMNGLEGHLLPGSEENAIEPMFSPDGRFLAYFASESGAPAAAQPYSLRKRAVDGGASVVLGSIPGAPFGGVWRNGLITFAMNAGSQCGIYAIPDTGGTPRALVTVDCATERAVQPDVLRDGRHIIFGVPLPMNTTRETASGEGPIVIDVIGGGQRKVLVQSGANPRVLPTGHLAYMHEGSIWAVPFDVDHPEVSSVAPVRLVENVAQTGASSSGQFAVSATGSLAYVAGNLAATLRRLVWVDRKGGEQVLAAPPNTFQQPRLSPDGTKVAVSAGANIWVWVLASDTPMRVTDEGGVEYNPAWSHDGRFLFFDLNAGGGTQIVRRPADGTGKSEVVVPVPGGYPESVSPDGKWLLYHTAPRVAMMAPLDGHGQTRPLLDGAAQVSDAEISPSGRWLAYESNESGRFEIYVRPWPDVESGRVPISSHGGQHPLWSRDGRELFFISGTGMMMSTTIKPGSDFAHDKPVELFSASPYYVNVARDYDVSLDGKRFLMVKTADVKGAKPPLVIVTNWFDDVQRRLRR